MTPTPPQGLAGFRVDLTIDSGAYRTVIPPTLGSGIGMVDVPARLQQGAETASGVQLLPQGMRTLQCAFLSGPRRSLECLVMDVNRPLVSVSQMISRGWNVTFQPEDDGGSYIHHPKLGDTHRIWPKDGVFVLPVVVTNDPSAQEPITGFPGPAKL